MIPKNIDYVDMKILKDLKEYALDPVVAHVGEINKDQVQHIHIRYSNLQWVFSRTVMHKDWVISCKTWYYVDPQLCVEKFRKYMEQEKCWEHKKER